MGEGQKTESLAPGNSPASCCIFFLKRDYISTSEFQEMLLYTRVNSFSWPRAV